MLTRRIFIIILSMLIISALITYLLKDNSETVRVYNWGNYIDEEILEQFHAETGIRVDYSVFENNEFLDVKLMSGDDKYDVVVPSLYFLDRQISMGFYQKLDKKKIPNLKNLSSEIMKKIAEIDSNNDYSVNYFFGVTAIGVNKEEIAKYIDNAPLDSLRMVFDIEIIKKVSKCGIYIIDEATEIIPTALLYLGLDPNSRKKEDLEKAEALLREISPYVKKYSMTEHTSALANGEACMIFAWTGDILQAKEIVEKNKNLRKIEMFIPQEGTQIWFDQMAIPKNAPNPDAAHKFINFILRPDIGAKVVRKIRYSSANDAAIKILLDEGNSDFIHTVNLNKAKTYTLFHYDSKSQKLITDIWLRIKTGNEQSF